MHSITSKDPSRKTLKDIILKCPQQVLTPVAVSFNPLGQVLLFATCLCYRLTSSELAAKQLGNTVAQSIDFNFPRDC